ncbi:NAD(P)-dependent oxidoreductase [Orrella sp. NBD-18]|uniref:NAD(P)-dependent oxidoreductase n=1 Tax=Sheuella amnicola TaxID=2707330 RepID=A0A6B2R4T9_9BURK|nr:NAD(P)-dependent oxidoreductase [Sheuella amnicola]NDY84067.1 NAD(P)-dependent oxidoreductase [Sheuella amnicola]HBI83007.1 oxidoreductase [Alcaligenaceae bacterium]
MAEIQYGFVGIGNMGTPMATRLLNAGKRVCVFDPNQQAVSALVARGAIKAESAAEVANQAETIFMSLPTPEIVLSVVTGPQGVIEGTRVKHVVDFSTIGPQAAVKAAQALNARSIDYVDAPVSGGVPGARAGTLAVMVSCPSGVFAALQPILLTFGKVFHLGEGAGQAQTMKLANNLLAAAAIAVSSEAMVMGVKAGLDPKVMLEVINAGSGRNSATQDKFTRSILTGGFDFGFGTGLAYKDIRLCINEAEALGVPMVIGAAVREMLAITNAMYGAESDYTSLCRVVESWAGVEVRG